MIRCTVAISRKSWDKYGVNIDTEANIVSLCPNCHRRIHFGSIQEKSEIIKRLYKLKQNGLRDIGITMTLDELKEIYKIQNILNK